MRLSLRSQRVQLFDSKFSLFMWWQINFQQQCDSKIIVICWFCARDTLLSMLMTAQDSLMNRKLKWTPFFCQIWDSVKSAIRKTCFVLLMIGCSFFFPFFFFRSSWCVFRELPFSPFTTIWAWPLNFSIRYDVYKSCSTFGKYVKALQYFL